MLLSFSAKSGYSLWLSPRSTETLFSDLILALSQRSSPPTVPFAPHATLYADSLIPPHLGLEQIIAATQQAISTLPADLNKVICLFDSVEAGKLFFQCVYVKLLKRESEGLLELHRALRQSFGSQDTAGDGYFPHLSLVYGNLKIQQKEDIIAGMREKQEIRSFVDGADAREAILGETHFETREILIVKTAGKSNEWEVAARVPLGQKAQLRHEDL